MRGSLIAFSSSPSQAIAPPANSRTLGSITIGRLYFSARSSRASLNFPSNGRSKETRLASRSESFWLLPVLMSALSSAFWYGLAQPCDRVKARTVVKAAATSVRTDMDQASEEM